MQDLILENMYEDMILNDYPDYEAELMDDYPEYPIEEELEEEMSRYDELEEHFRKIEKSLQRAISNKQQKIEKLQHDAENRKKEITNLKYAQERLRHNTGCFCCNKVTEQKCKVQRRDNKINNAISYMKNYINVEEYNDNVKAEFEHVIGILGGEK